MLNYQEIDTSTTLAEQFDAYCASLTAPAYLGEQVGAWSTWLAWVEGDGAGNPTGMYSGRISDLNPLQGEILMERDLGRC